MGYHDFEFEMSLDSENESEQSKDLKFNEETVTEKEDIAMSDQDGFEAFDQDILDDVVKEENPVYELQKIM